MMQMREVIFGSACMVSGLLLALMMLYLGENPNAYDGLNVLGKGLVWAGIIAAVIGVAMCVSNLGSNRKAEDDSKDE